MKAYGLKRVIYDGVSGCLEQGASSKCMKMSSHSRKSARRIFKKAYRVNWKAIIRSEING